MAKKYLPYRLNPCFNGIWSASVSGLVSYIAYGVLILVLMEYGLRAMRKLHVEANKHGLNPCFNGIWSARVKSVKICM